MLQSIIPLASNSYFTSCHTPNPSVSTFLFLPSLAFFYKRKTVHTVSAHFRTKPRQWLAQATEPPNFADVARPSTPEDGPIELSPDTPSIFATTDDPTPLQTATSVLLTGAITVFLFRSIRRRAKRAKELKFRSSGANKTLKDEALDSLKAMGTLSVKPGSPPSPAQALLGGVAAGVIALILYKFTTTIEASLNRQTISDNFSVRQITITIRTIINGICYLATFVFGINSIGLFLYSGQLVLNSLFESEKEESKKEAGTDEGKQPGSSTKTAEIQSTPEVFRKDSDQNSDAPQ